MVALADVLVPPNEEGTRATVLKWCKRVGESVEKDEPLVELETDKVTVEIPSPASGTLIEILKQVDAEVIPDEVIARLSLGGAVSAPRGGAWPAGAESAAGVESRVGGEGGAGAEAGDGEAGDGAEAGASAAFQAPRTAAAAGAAAVKPLSPSVRRLLKEHSIAAADIGGTGRDGRITAQDVIRHAANAVNRANTLTRANATGAPDAPDARGAPEAAKQAPAAHARAQGAAVGGTRVPHTAIRRRVAEHMARSLMESPHVTTLFEADLTRVLAHRSRHAADYEARGARLTLTAYFISACTQALRLHREVNATFLPEALELHADVNVGVGTALGNKGLIVPVIHRAQGLNLFGIAQRLGTLVEAARAGKLTPEDVRGGTFTISNHGVGGSLLAAPIVINQPQVAILGVGSVVKEPVVVDDAIAIRSTCYLALTFDHRLIDGALADQFTAKVKSILEGWAEEVL
jgi:2-oxoglutarate dehydrogenase E2 component (dihydrolipoamide succinyltransferase)